MLKEQLLGLAMKAIARAYDTRAKLKKNLNSEMLQNYVRSLKEAALWTIENRLKPGLASEHLRVDSPQEGHANGRSSTKARGAKGARMNTPVSGQALNLVLKKERKSSIRPAKEIDSRRAETILLKLKKDASRVVKAGDHLRGKKSLAYLVWALGHAERAGLKEGISVHDVSSLLYRACKIELYPINISRVVHSNEELVRQAGQEKRTKTYLLTPSGTKIFKEKFMSRELR